MCLEDNGGGNFTAWMLVQFNDVARPFGTYGGPLWVRLGDTTVPPVFSETPPLGPVGFARINDSIEAFNPSNGPLHILGDYTIETTIGVPPTSTQVFADVAQEACDV